MDNTTSGMYRLKESIDKSSQINRTLIISYILILAFIAIAVGSTSDKKLFIPESSFNIPIFSFQLRVDHFFKIIPIVIIFLHYVLLFSINLHSEKLLLFHNLSYSDLSHKIKETTLFNIHPFIYNHFGRFKFQAQKIINIFAIHTIVFILPLSLLFLILIRFADYQSSIISTFHYIIILFDLILIRLYSYKISELLLKKKHHKLFIRFYLGIFIIATFYFFFLLVFFNSDYISIKLGNNPTETNVNNTNRFAFFKKGLYKLCPALDLENEILIKYMPTREIFELKLLGDRNQDEISALARELLQTHTLSFNLNERNFKFANFKNCILNKSNFQNCDLSNAIFTDAQLKYVNYTNSKLNYSCFDGAKLEGSDFSNTLLQKASFVDVICHGVCFKKAKMVDAKFVGTNLYGVVFDSTDLRKSDFENAYLNGSTFSHALCDSTLFHMSDLRGVDFFNSSFQKAYFTDAKVNGLVVYKCKFFESNFGVNCTDTIQLFDPKYYPSDTLTTPREVIDYKFSKTLSVYTVDSAIPNTHFLKVRREIAVANEFIAISMLNSTNHKLNSGRLTAYSIFYRDMFFFIGKTKSDFLRGYEYNAQGEKLSK